MIKNTVAAGIAALAVAGVLGGAAITSAAQAATAPATTAAATAGPIAPAPLYSKGFHLQNNIGGVSLELVSVEGPQEGVPPIGSSIADGQWQDFEVQYVAAGTGNVWATYQVNDDSHGFEGDVEIKMSYDCWGDTTTTIALDNSAIPMYITGGHGTNPAINND